MTDQKYIQFSPELTADYRDFYQNTEIDGQTVFLFEYLTVSPISRVYKLLKIKKKKKVKK